MGAPTGRGGGGCFSYDGCSRAVGKSAPVTAVVLKALNPENP